MSLNCSRDLLHRFVSKVTTDSFYLERNIFQDLCIYLFAIFIMRIFYGYILTFSGLEKFLDNDGDHQKPESHRQDVIWERFRSISLRSLKYNEACVVYLTF